MTETEWAIRNLALAGWFEEDSDYGGMIGQAVLRLLECHQREGHSGASHSLAVRLFFDVARGQSLTLRHWEERFKEYNRMAKKMGGDEWTEETFQENTGNKKPKPAELSKDGE